MQEVLRKKIHEAAQFLELKGVSKPKIGIILGSGLNDYADEVEDAIRIPYSEIPHFATGSVSGHRGEVVYGKLHGKRVIIMAGRFHFYEGRSMELTTLPTRVMIELGIKRLIITNSAGCINDGWKAGSFMLISDHINLSGTNPLIGENLEEYGPRFPDMSDIYDKKLREKLKMAAVREGIYLEEGVYTMMSGPSFETPAEIRFLRTIGADAVGMSSVPEAIIANQALCEIIGISLMANMAAGILNQQITGAEVNEAGKKARKEFGKIVDLAIRI